MVPKSAGPRQAEPYFIGTTDTSSRKFPIFATETSYLVRINPALSSPFIVNAKHKMPRAFKVDIEDLFNHVHDEVHRSMIVVQERHTSC
jgi:hypothetical protein